MSNSAGFKLFAGLKGSKVITVGAEDSVFNFTTLAEAVAAANPKDIIHVYKGTYTLTSTLTINKDLTIIGIGGPNEVIVTSALTTTPTVLCNVPASHNAAVTQHFYNMMFTNSAAGSAVEIDNDGGAAQSLYVDFNNCSITNSSTGYAVELVNTTATKDIFLSITGNPAQHKLGKSLFNQPKAASIVFIYGMHCTTTFALDASAVAATFDMIGCVYNDAAQTAGGGVGRLLNYVGNMKGVFTAGIAKSGAGDFDATGTELHITLA